MELPLRSSRPQSCHGSDDFLSNTGPMTQQIIFRFVTLLAILDAAGMLAIFLAVTAEVDSHQRGKLAILNINDARSRFSI